MKPKNERALPAGFIACLECGAYAVPQAREGAAAIEHRPGCPQAPAPAASA